MSRNQYCTPGKNQSPTPRGKESLNHPGITTKATDHRTREYRESPLVVTWETTQACDLSCDHCRAEAAPNRSSKELTTDEGIDLFAQVAEFSLQPILVLSGGDPLKRPDLFELLEAAVDLGVTPSVTPATTPLLTREIIERFEEIGIGRMALSIDGATAESHDRFRGENGTFETAIRAAEQAADLGVSIQINTTVTASTVDDLPQIADLVDHLNAAMWEVFFLVPIGRGETLGQLSPTKARKVMQWLYQRGRDAPYHVITVEAPFYRRVAHETQREQGKEPRHVGSTGAGNGFVFVSHTGEVFPSGFLPLSAGNIRNKQLPEIYRNAELMQQLRDRQSFNGPCGNCSFTSICGGSRSRAYAATGNPIGSDPLCVYTSENDSPMRSG